MPDSQPEPAELWIDAGPGRSHHGGPPTGSGGTGRARWIALTVGFLVLVAVIAVQHFATGRSITGSGTVAISQSDAQTTPSPADRTSTQQASSTAAPDHTTSDGPRSYAPTESIDTALSQALASLSSAHQVGGTAGDGPTDAPDTTVPDTTSPSTTTVPKQALPGAGDWELLGFGSNGVVRYRPSTGALTVTPVPTIFSNNLLSFVVTRSAAIIRSMDNVDGYLVSDGKPARPLAGLLAQGTKALPGPHPGDLWVVQESYAATTQGSGADGTDTSGEQILAPNVSLNLVNANGTQLGTRIDLPAALYSAGAYGILPDGAGYALAYGVGGIYDVRPDAVHLVTHGHLMAVGPTGFLAYECDDNARCGAVAIDRATWDRHPLPDVAVRVGALQGSGVISPDGTRAAVLNFGSTGIAVDLIDMNSGKVVRTPVDISGAMAADTSQLLVFSPDGRYLLVSAMNGVVPIDTSTGKARPPLPIPPVDVLAIRPGS